MKRFRILMLILFAMSLLLLSVSTVRYLLRRDKTYPTITCPSDPLVISVENSNRETLCAAVSAHDDKDGDLTSSLMVDVAQRSGGVAVATYSVVDSDNHIATKTREIHYTDYYTPRFSLSKELRYSVGSTIRIQDRLTVEDALDGDISDYIKVTVGNVSSYAEGVYPVTFQVTNHIGDTSSVTLEVAVENYDPGEPVISLNTYLVYVKAGETLNPKDYLKAVTNAELSAVTWTLPEKGFTVGTNKVEYTCVSETGVSGHATLFVIGE